MRPRENELYKLCHTALFLFVLFTANIQFLSLRGSKLCSTAIYKVGIADEKVCAFPKFQRTELRVLAQHFSRICGIAQERCIIGERLFRQIEIYHTQHLLIGRHGLHRGIT